MKRFSKKAIAEYISNRMNELERKYGFNFQNGWDQVNGKPIEVMIAYGEYDGLDKLYRDLDDIKG